MDFLADTIRNITFEKRLLKLITFLDDLQLTSKFKIFLSTVLAAKRKKNILMCGIRSIF